MTSKLSTLFIVPAFLASATLPLPLLQHDSAHAAPVESEVMSYSELQANAQVFVVPASVVTASVERDLYTATTQAELDAIKAEEERKAAEAAAAALAAENAARDAATAAEAAKKKSSSTSKGSSANAPAPNPGSAQAYAQQAVAARGWSNADYNCLVSLWNKESGWRSTAINPNFNPRAEAIPENQAYGIAQAAPGAKMASAGADWKTNANTQIEWGLGYIASVYGTPCSAWGHSVSNNWY